MSSFYNLGFNFEKLGKLPEALSFYSGSLKIQKNNDTYNAIDYGNTLKHMANVYLLNNSLSSAVTHFKEAYTVFQKSLRTSNKNDKVLHFTIYGLGICYVKKEDYDTSLQYLYKAFAIMRKHYGDDHEKIANVLHNIGFAHKRNLDYKKALQCYEKVLMIRKDNLGEDHLLVANSLYHLAMIQVDIGRFADALKNCHESLIRYLKIYDSSKSKSAGQYISNIKCWISLLTSKLGYYERKRTVRFKIGTN